MNARREPSGHGWLYLFCSLIVLLLSWVVRPESARHWLEAQLAVLRSPETSEAREATSTGPGDFSGATAGGAARTADAGRRITLYLPSRAVPGMLDAVDVSVGNAETTKELAVEAVNLLAAPGAGTGHKAALPAGTRVLAIFAGGGKAVVDLSSELVAAPPLSAAEARVSFYALVNTLTSLPFADEVRILVGDEERATYFDSFDLTVPYRFNPDIVAQRSTTGKTQ